MARKNKNGAHKSGDPRKNSRPMYYKGHTTVKAINTGDKPLPLDELTKTCIRNLFSAWKNLYGTDYIATSNTEKTRLGSGELDTVCSIIYELLKDGHEANAEFYKNSLDTYLASSLREKTSAVIPLEFHPDDDANIIALKVKTKEDVVAFELLEGTLKEVIRKVS